MFNWLKDDSFMNVIATWLFRAYIVCGLIVFIICIAYFGYTWIKHIKRVQEFKKLLKEHNYECRRYNERVHKNKDEDVH